MLVDITTRSIKYQLHVYRISGIFSLREIFAKMTIRRCVKFAMRPIFAISRALKEDV